MEDFGGRGPFVLPLSHRAGMRVPRGGSSCANCRFLLARPDGPHCANDFWVLWNGGDSKLPVRDPSTYCSDWYEIGRRRR